MQPAIRTYYHLEEIWGEKPVRIKLGAPKPVIEKPPAAVKTVSAKPAAKKTPTAAKKTPAVKNDPQHPVKNEAMGGCSWYANP